MRYRYTDGQTFTDYSKKQQAIAAMLRQNGGQVWTEDGSHLIAWITYTPDTTLNVLDLREGKTLRQTVRKIERISRVCGCVYTFLNRNRRRVWLVRCSIHAKQRREARR